MIVQPLDQSRLFQNNAEKEQARSRIESIFSQAQGITDRVLADLDRYFSLFFHFLTYNVNVWQYITSKYEYASNHANGLLIKQRIVVLQ